MPRTAAEKISRFFDTDIWRLNREELSKPRAFLLKPLRMIVLTVKGFMRDNCALQASALTFYSLLSIVPVVAMAFGIAKGFGLDQRLEKQIYLRFAGQEEVLSRVIAFARSLLENTKGGLIAGVGVILLFWSAVKVLSHIENTLNHIWKVQARSSIRRFTDYLSIMMISPLLVVISSSVNVYITTQVTAMTGRLALLQAASPIIFLLLKLLPFGLIWLLFILIYIVMPNTHVRLTSAILAGVTGGTIFQITQGIYISAQVLVSKYNAIYGSFAALPLFLMWLQLSWMIVLIGAEIAHTHQSISQFSMAADFGKTSIHDQHRYALHILRLIIERFKQGEEPLTADQMARRLKLPPALVLQLVSYLHESALVSAVAAKKNNGPAAYQPARDIRSITIASVLEALDRRGEKNWSAANDPDFERVCQAVDAMQAQMADTPANRLVQDI
jgi:membrane protein